MIVSRVLLSWRRIRRNSFNLSKVSAETKQIWSNIRFYNKPTKQLDTFIAQGIKNESTIYALKSIMGHMVHLCAIAQGADPGLNQTYTFS